MQALLMCKYLLFSVSRRDLESDKVYVWDHGVFKLRKHVTYGHYAQNAYEMLEFKLK